MDALVRAAPPPGSANAGDLYVDLQSRTLWLGVDPAVDPAAFVLISDIVALQAEIDGAVVESKGYTDAQILTRAPTVHNHVASQITDFTAAVQAVIAATPSATINRGMIAMFSGTLAEIGVGIWASWALCDGGNGTPDLRDKFILGAGNRATGATNSVASLTTSPADGVHTHVINGTAITEAQMPYHSHTGATGYVSADHAHVQQGSFLSGGRTAQHTHPYTGASSPTSSAHAGSTSSHGGHRGSSTAAQTGGEGEEHQHWVTIGGYTSGISANHNHGITAQGGNQAHDHVANNAGGTHDHIVTAAQLRDTTPYYALAFIMKL